MAGHLVPALAPAVPDGFTELYVPLVNGLPHTLRLTDQWSLVVAIPTGLAQSLRSEDPRALFASSARQLAAREAGDGPRDRAAPARVFLKQGRALTASLPLIAGLVRRAPLDGLRPGGPDLVLIGWEFRAGTLAGPGDFGSWLRLAFRDPGAKATFEAPPVHPEVKKRLPPAAVFASEHQ
jgi:hypothetical protein